MGNKKNIFRNSIKIPLHNFRYLHHTHNKESKDDCDFLGREKQKKKLLDILTDSKNAKGAYLITGYRGSGKTSFINNVIKTYININDDKNKTKTRKKKKIIYDVRLNLANDQSLNPYQIYKRMAYGLLKEKPRSFMCLSLIVLFFLSMISIIYIDIKLIESNNNIHTINTVTSENKTTNTLIEKNIETITSNSSERFLSKTYTRYGETVTTIVLFLNFILLYLLLEILYKSYRKHNKVGALKKIISDIENENNFTFNRVLIFYNVLIYKSSHHYDRFYPKTVPISPLIEPKLAMIKSLSFLSLSNAFLIHKDAA